MKKNNYLYFLLLGIALISSEVVHAQVQANGALTTTIKNQNPFFDGSTNFNAGTNKGKGLLFPQTNLTTFSFIVTALDAIVFPSAFNGMIVYNTGTGNTLTTGNNPSTSTAVTPGFYYFSNPGASTSVINGRWVRMNDNLATTIPQGNSLPATGNKIGDVFYLVGTGLQVFDGSSWSGIGSPVVNNLTSTSGTSALSANMGKELNDTKAPLNSPTFTGTVSGITAAMVGLNNVNNTADADKPVSTATQTALNAKMTKATYDADDNGVVDAAATATTATSATTATTATNLAGGVAGGVAFQSAAGTTAVTAAGTAGYLLQSNGTDAPTWVAAPVVPVTSVAGQTGAITLAMMGLDNVNNTTDVNKPVSTATQTALNAKMTKATYDADDNGVVDAAATATTATLLAGGVAGGVAYQSAAGTTAVTAAGTAGYLLQSNGTDAPTWVAAPSSGVTSIAGQTGVVTLAGIGLDNVNNTSDANKPVSTATQTALNAKMTTATYDANTDGVVDAAATAATATTATSATTATTATNLAGGVAGGVAYQSAAGTTAVTAAGTAGYLLQSNGTDAPTWVAAPSSGVTSIAGQTGVVTLAGIGLDNVNNTSDANKPVSTATQTALNAKMTTATYDANTDGVVDVAATAATATSATTATNLAGGVAGGVAYQSAAGTSAVTAAGTAGYLLQSNGAAAPTWVAAPTSVTNLGYTPDATSGVLTSSTGTGITISEASTTVAGLLNATDKIKLNALSNTNSGDETLATIKSKLGAASTTADGYLTAEDWNKFSGKLTSTDATSANTADKIVLRDASGNFAAGAVTASSVISPSISTSDNADLTLSAGTGTTIVGGAFKMGGAVYATVRTHSANTNIVWTATDYMVIITNNDIDTKLALPTPTVALTGRVLGIINHTEGVVTPLAIDGISWPSNANNLAATAAVQFICTGTSWELYAGR